MVVTISAQDSLSVHLDESTVPKDAIAFRGPEDLESELTIPTMDYVRSQLLEEEVPASLNVVEAATRLWVTLGMHCRSLGRPKFEVDPSDKAPKPIVVGTPKAFWCPYKTYRDRAEDAARRLLSKEARAFLDALSKSKQKYFLPQEIEDYVVRACPLRTGWGRLIDVAEMWRCGAYMRRNVGGYRELVLAGLLKKIGLTAYYDGRQVEQEKNNGA
jgi:hypothetical protein